MGRIKTVLIKRITRQVMTEHGEKFTKDFDENQKVLNEIIELPSKKMRNTIAGYTTRLVKMKDRQPAHRKSRSSEEKKYADYEDR
jgi:small subunit ribosomal protein S17e